ncbi:MAG: LamG domain-containing protein [Sedimentisphaerales bacterium]|nr:LamG domain-containing protein [Sedimentisphaerales bacterium]
MPKAGWIAAWLILFRGISALVGAEVAFEYPSALVDAYDADASCWEGMGLDGEYPVGVVPGRWLVGPPPSEFTGVTMPTDHWVHLLFSGRIVPVDGSDIEVVESGAAGERAIVFLTDGADQEYALGIIQADGSGAQLLSKVHLTLPDFPITFVPRGVRIVALDRGGMAPGFDVGSVCAWIMHDCGPGARYPAPAHESLDVPTDVKLSWLSACGTDLHGVYLSTDSQAVVSGAPEAQFAVTDPNGNSFEPPELQLGRQYYWRVKEANSVDANDARLSDLWSFRVTDRLLIDDIEAYGGWGPSVYEAWRTADLARPALEVGIFRSCRQSLKFGYYYDNYDGGAYSEVYHVFDEAQDWTRSGIEVFEFWLHGTAGNSTSGPLYVVVSDGTHESRYTLDSDTNAALLTTAHWQPCRIPLSEFAGVNLTGVVSVGIGVSRASDLPKAYGSGTVYIDDVSLRPALCLEKRRVEADLNADCSVDYRDVEQMASQWLAGRIEVAPVTAPNEPVLWYKFDGDALDSAGTSHGQVQGRPAYVPGKRGRAIHFTAAGDAVTVSQVANVFGRIRDALTISFWQYGDDSEHLNDTVCCSNYVYGRENPSIAIHLGCWRNPGFYRWDCGTPWSMDNRVAGRHRHKSEWAGRWNHWAFVKDSVTGKMEIYHNGLLYDSRAGTTSPIEAITSFEIGSGWYGRYDGLIDDFQIYDYALHADEVAYLASDGTGLLEQATAPLGDLDGNDIVDLADYAILAGQWLEHQLWP